MNNIKNIRYNVLSKAWATLYRIDYDFQFKNGSWKTISRECYNRGNGTGVLLYNTDKQTVILTKQFRMPAFSNNESEGMSIEVCAGALDKGEDPETCIIREIEEEVGYKLTKVTKVLESYMSPGAVSEKMYLFVAAYTDDMKVNGGGGLASEDEEIEVLELPFDMAIKMVDTHEIIDAKTQLLLQYALINDLMKCKN